MKRGRLIAFDGLDGCGKSTQIALLRQRLAAEDLVFTREPTNGPHGRRIRAAARSGDGATPEQQLAWFFADRAEHVERVVEPALLAGRHVVTDRYFLATVAYQGARGLDWREILRDSEARFPLPDLALLLVIDPATGLERVAARGGHAEPLFEERGFLERVAEIFAAIDRPYVRRLDATRQPEAVAADVEAAVRDVLGR